MGPMDSKAAKPDPKVTTAEPRRSYVRSSAIAFSTQTSLQRLLPKNLTRMGFPLPSAVWKGCWRNRAFKKKLHLYYPLTAPFEVETHRTKQKVRRVVSDPPQIERGVRQLLANKISGTLVGIWLLIPEYLRLGIWDLLKSWSEMPDERVEPRLALQRVNESALGGNGIRMKRSLSQKGFELANGLPFVATDSAVHELLDCHEVAQAQRLQIVLGKVRQTFGHFKGKIIVIDPHRLSSCSKRQLVRRQKDKESNPTKMAQTFFALDADTQQPLCLITASSARTTNQATPELLTLATAILKSNGYKPLVLADNEHYSVELLAWISSQSPFDMLSTEGIKPTIPWLYDSNLDFRFK